MIYLNTKFNTGMLTLRILNIIVVLTALFPLISGIILLISLNFYGIGLISIGLFLIGFSYILLEHNGIRNQFIIRVNILNDKIIFIYKNERKTITVPYNTIIRKKITERGAIWYYSSINKKLSYDFREGLISSTLLDENIFNMFEKSLKNYQEKNNIIINNE